MKRGRVSIVLLLAFFGFLPGCTASVLDAAAAGGLNFVQSGVSTILASLVFPEAAASNDMTSMPNTMMAGGDHSDHGG